MALRITLAVPEKPLVRDAACDWVIAPATLGYVQILPGHAEYTATLGVGELRFAEGATVRRFAVKNGFLEVKQDAVTVLADVAEARETIVAEDAHRAFEDAKRQLDSARTTEEVDEALEQVRKAEVWMVGGKD